MARKIIVIVGKPSAGKTTAESMLIEMGRTKVVSSTTRPPRAGEEYGVDYHFMTESEFQFHMRSGHMVQYDQVYGGYWFGATYEEYEKADSLVVVVNVTGAKQVKEAFGDDALVILIDAPLKDRFVRAEKRDHVSLEDFLEREKDYEDEDFQSIVDYTVVNDGDMVEFKSRVEWATTELWR